MKSLPSRRVLVERQTNSYRSSACVSSIKLLQESSPMVERGAGVLAPAMLRMMRNLLRILLRVTWFAMGCSRGDPGQSRPAEDDVAGVATVQIAVTPEYELSEERNSTLVLEDVWRAALLDSNHVLLLGFLPPRLEIIQLPTKQTLALSRRGGGPGEYRSLGDFAVLGDTIAMYDHGSRRLTWWSLTGRVIRMVSVSDQVPSNVIRLAGITSDGHAILFSSGQFESTDDRSSVRTTSRVLRVDLEGQAHELTSIPDVRRENVTTFYGGAVASRFVPVRLAERAHAVLVGSLIVTSTQDPQEIQLLTASGEHARTIRLRRERRAVTDQMKSFAISEELRERVRERKGEPLADPNETERLIREAPYADSISAFESLHASNDGWIWVVEGIAPTDTGWTATAFTVDGTEKARVQYTGRSLPLAFSRSRVLVRATDGDGQVVLRVHRLPIAESS